MSTATAPPTTLPTTPLQFHELSFLDEGDGDILIGRADIDSYGVFPADGAALVEQLRSGRPPGEAAAWYLHTFGESVDMPEFIDTLTELELILEPGTTSASTRSTPVSPTRSA